MIPGTRFISAIMLASKTFCKLEICSSSNISRVPSTSVSWKHQSTIIELFISKATDHYTIVTPQYFSEE
jgi:hypothetical protein